MYFTYQKTTKNYVEVINTNAEALSNILIKDYTDTPTVFCV
jgi:hypothetical protein